MGSISGASAIRKPLCRTSPVPARLGFRGRPAGPSCSDIEASCPAKLLALGGSHLALQSPCLRAFDSRHLREARGSPSGFSHPRGSFSHVNLWFAGHAASRPGRAARLCHHLQHRSLLALRRGAPGRFADAKETAEACRAHRAWPRGLPEEGERLRLDAAVEGATGQCNPRHHSAVAWLPTGSQPC